MDAERSGELRVLLHEFGWAFQHTCEHIFQMKIPFPPLNVQSEQYNKMKKPCYTSVVDA